MSLVCSLHENHLISSKWKRQRGVRGWYKFNYAAIVQMNRKAGHLFSADVIIWEGMSMAST